MDWWLRNKHPAALHDVCDEKVKEGEKGREERPKARRCVKRHSRAAPGAARSRSYLRAY